MITPSLLATAIYVIGVAALEMANYRKVKVSKGFLPWRRNLRTT